MFPFFLNILWWLLILYIHRFIFVFKDGLPCRILGTSFAFIWVLWVSWHPGLCPRPLLIKAGRFSNKTICRFIENSQILLVGSVSLFLLLVNLCIKGLQFLDLTPLLNFGGGYHPLREGGSHLLGEGGTKLLGAGKLHPRKTLIQSSCGNCAGILSI